MADKDVNRINRLILAARRRAVRRGSIYLAAIGGRETTIDRRTALRLYQQAMRLLRTLSHYVGDK